MKITLPQKFPVWSAKPDGIYTSDIVRSRNIRLSELEISGEVDVQNTLSLTSAQTELVSSIFKEPNHLLSFALKNKSYYIDSFTNPTITQYSPDLASLDNLNPASSGMVPYLRGYPKFDSQTHYNSQVTISTADINTFVNVTGYTRTYVYAGGQYVVALRFVCSYTQSAGTNIVRCVVTDSTGVHVVAGNSSAVASGHSWDFWVVDGAGGCNLNETGGFVVNIQVATDSAPNSCVFVINNSHIDFFYEIGEASLISTGINGLVGLKDINGSQTYSPWYPGSTSYNAQGYLLGYPQNSSSFVPGVKSVLKTYNDRYLLIGSGRYLSWVENTTYATATASTTYVQYLNVPRGTFALKLTLPESYIINWIDCTDDNVYI